MVIGGPTTLPALRNACDVFVSYENLLGARSGVLPPERPAPTVRPATGRSPPRVERRAGRLPAESRETLVKAFENAAGESERANLGQVAEAAKRLDPGFDPRTYGSSNWVDLLKALPEDFVVEQPRGSGPGPTYVLRKREPV